MVVFGCRFVSVSEMRGFVKKIFPVAYVVLRLLRMMRCVRTSPQLRVLLYHDISPDEVQLFERQLRYLKKRWDFIGAEAFEDHLLGRKKLEKNSLLLTFDDGFLSNKLVANEVLARLEIKAVFFIVKNLVEAVSESDKFQAMRNIYPSLSDSKMPSHWGRMNYDDLRGLMTKGHTIGFHTKSHLRLSECRSDELLDELCSGVEQFESQLGVKIAHFAFPFGNLESFSKNALAIARGKFSFVHTGLRGNNFSNPLTWAIRRDSLVPTDSFSKISFILEGGLDRLFYSSKVKTYEAWGR